MAPIHRGYSGQIMEDFENQFLELYLKGENIASMPDDHFRLAMRGLIAKGLVEVLQDNNRVIYCPTPLLKQIKQQYKEKLNEYSSAD